MPLSFWIRRFLLAAVGAFTLFAGVYVLRGQPWRPALADAALWAVISAGIFVAVGWYKVRNGRACEVCAVPPPDVAAKEQIDQGKP